MNYELAGRSVRLAGPDREVLAACAEHLIAEGAHVLDVEGGEPDIVIVAGARRAGSRLLGDTSAADLYAAWDDAVDAVDCYRAAAQPMTSRGWGRMVWIGNAQAKSVDAAEDEFAAVVSLGILGLHKVIAQELGRGGVTANAVLRGGEANDDDVATAAVFLCSAGASYLSGITIVIDGGVGSAVF